MVLRFNRCLMAILIATMAQAQDPLSIDQKHYIVEVNNDRVRALRVRYGPGEGSPMHEHPDGVGVTLTPTKSRFQMFDGSTREGGARPAGVVFWRGATRHANQNLLPETAEMIEIDLKGLPAVPPLAVSEGRSPDPTETIELENQFIRVLRSRIPPKGKTASHTHPDSVVVILGERGRVLWMPAGEESMVNLGSELVERIVVELKPLSSTKR
jgi:quercetin dioxygenase-like cupin family protein